VPLSARPVYSNREKRRGTFPCPLVLLSGGTGSGTYQNAVSEERRNYIRVKDDFRECGEGRGRRSAPLLPWPMLYAFPQSDKGGRED